MLLFLVDTSIHLQGSTGHVYVEVVLHGETDGKFLEDPDAHRFEMTRNWVGFSDARPNEKLTVRLPNF